MPTTQLSQTPKYFLTYEYLFYFNKFQLLFNFFKKSILYNKLEFLNLAIYTKLNNDTNIFFKFKRRSRVKKKNKINFFFLRKKNLYKTPRLNFRILFKIDKTNNKKIRKITSLNRSILLKLYRKRRRIKKLRKRKLLIKDTGVIVFNKHYFYTDIKTKLKPATYNRSILKFKSGKQLKLKLRYRKRFLTTRFKNFRKLVKTRVRSFRRLIKFLKLVTWRRKFRRKLSIKPSKKFRRKLKIQRIKLKKKENFFSNVFTFFKIKSLIRFSVKRLVCKYIQKSKLRWKRKYRRKPKYPRPSRLLFKPLKFTFFRHSRKSKSKNITTRLYQFKYKFRYRRHYGLYNFFKLSRYLIPKSKLKKIGYGGFKRLTSFIQLRRNSLFLFQLSSFFKNKTRRLKKPFKMRQLFYNITFLSKRKQPLILHNIGMVLPFKFLYKHRELHVFRIKKKIFSFLKINELKMFVFKTKKKLLLRKIFFLILNKKKFHKFRKLTNKSIYTYFKDSSITKYLGNNSLDFYKVFTTEEVFKKANIYKFRSNFKKKKFKGRELHISRIKFKPGYQRLWRQFRLAFAESINYKYIYQQQLTRYFVSFYRKLNHTYFSQNENTIIKVIIYSKLVPDTSVFALFMNNNLIFLNNKVLKHAKFYLYRNDFIQLEISNWHYLYMRFTLNEVHSRQNKFKRLVYRKSLAGRYKLMKQKKQRSNYTPNWIFTTLYDLADIKSNLEVDFFTLSVFFLYDSNYLHYTTPKDLFVARHNIYRLYNWKYIN